MSRTSENRVFALAEKGSLHCQQIDWPVFNRYNFFNKSLCQLQCGFTVPLLWSFERGEVELWLRCCFMVTVRHTAQTASVHDHWLTGKCLPGPCKVVISPPCGMSSVDLSDYTFTPLQHKACFCSVLSATQSW